MGEYKTMGMAPTSKASHFTLKMKKIKQINGSTNT
jgi:hypothetical protein